MRRLAVGVIGLAACGRIGFDETARSARSTLTIDSAAISEPLIDFPIAVVLDDQRAQREWIAADASNVRFRDRDGTLLAHEIEQVGSLGGAPLVAWVRVPRLDGARTLTVEYGDDAGPMASGPMWDASYLGVWHMHGTGALVDSTENDLDGVVTGTTTEPGLIGAARSFDASRPDAIVVPRGASLGFPQLTLMAWIHPRTAPVATTGYFAVITREYELTPEDDFYLGTIGLNLNAGVASVTGGSPFFVGPEIAIARWTHLALSYDGVTSRIFIDGVEVDRGPASGTPVASAGPIYIGCGRNDEAGANQPLGVPDVDFMNGMLDEIRLEQVGRSPAWIATEVASMRDALISYGPIEPL